MKKNLLIIILMIATTAHPTTNTPPEKGTFDILAVPSLQNGEKDWWYWVPSEFGPKISEMSPVCKEQRFNLFIIFNNYAATEDSIAQLTYDVTMFTPDGNTDFALTNAPGWNKKVNLRDLIPAESVVSISADPEDPYGEYTIKVTAYDHVAATSIVKKVTVKVIPFELPKEFPRTAEETGAWFTKYARHPDPVKALAAFLNPPQPYFDKNGEPIWSAVNFYKVIFEENKFLIPHMLEYFKTATEQQQKDIAMMLRLLNRMNELPKLSKPVQFFAESLNEICVPNPYDKITTGSQQDMLWAEFFATGRIKPIRHLLTSFNYSEYMGTLKKLKNKELVPSPEVQGKAMLEAVFQAGLWSIQSNCMQSDLCWQYCIALNRYGDLQENQRSMLGILLKKVDEKRAAESRPSESND